MYCSNILRIVLVSILFSSFAINYCLGVDSRLLIWGTHQGTSSPNPDFINSGTDPSSINFLLQLSADGSSTSNLDGTSGASNYNGDLVELGFFDTNALYDASDTSSITPNTDSSNMFKGVWTPLTSKTTIGQDWYSGSDVGNGLFFFKTSFSESDPAATLDGIATTNANAADDYDIMDDTLNSFSASDYSSSSTNDLADRVIALNDSKDSSTPLVGLRFYDASTGTSGQTKYNTIMNASWVWPDSGGNLIMVLNDPNNSHNTTSGLVFQYDNSDANSAGISKIGTGDNTINSNDFVATITYHDGSSNMDLSSASHVLSGLDGSGTITGGGDHVITLDTPNASNSYTFAGDIEGASDSNVASTLLKTGEGKQILSGDIRLEGTSSGWVNINNGTLSLAGSSKAYKMEYLTGSGGTLELNTTDVVELGFANTSVSQNFDGNLSLSASGPVTIKVAKGTSDGNYSNEQKVSGVVSGTQKLIKTGVGKLVLAEDNTNSGGIDVDDGTLVIGNDNNDADAGSGTITINKGKLEVLSGDTVGNTVSGGSGKSMIGGDGTITTVTVGSGSGEIDVISPGEGHSTSTSSSSSNQQVARNDSLADAIGSMTITTLNLNAGSVYDWEIGDFSGSTAGSDWDLLNIGTLNWDNTAGTALTINILPLAADGSAGSSAGGMWSEKLTTNGFKIMDFSSWSGTNALSSSQKVDNVTIDNSFWLYYKNDPYADWSVWYDHSQTAFYLQYSVAPEPSTYVMVTGLMLVPGMGAVRNYRNRKKKQTAEDSTPGISA